jgi:hypothetical protein
MKRAVTIQIFVDADAQVSVSPQAAEPPRPMPIEQLLASRPATPPLAVSRGVPRPMDLSELGTPGKGKGGSKK